MALCRDKVLVKRFSHDSPPARSILRAVPTGDRFRTLLEELRHDILGRISFEEAARAHISSGPSNWSTTQSQVILDKFLFEERVVWIERHPDAWVNKVTEILTNLHGGPTPIQKLVLHIPEMQFKGPLYINILLSCLSRNSIKELSVDNWNIITCKLSSIIFGFTELTRLMLRNCAFYKPIAVFQNLRALRLEKIAFGSDKVGNVTLSTPLLVRAELVHCSGFQYLNIDAPKLERFVVASGDGMSRDDVNQMRLNLGKPILEEQGGDLHRCILGSRVRCGHRCCPGCQSLLEPRCRLIFFFYPLDNNRKFVFCTRGQRVGR